VINQITRVRNLTNGTPARFNLLAGDMCYANADGDIAPIINPDGPHGKQPGSGNTPKPPASSGGWDYYDPWIWTSWFPMTADPDKQTGPYVSERDFSQRFEDVDWSQARYDDYGFVALDVTPAPAGQRTTMTLRFINEQGRELDRVVFNRIAGAGLVGHDG
jgi:hypothetical protein